MWRIVCLRKLFAFYTQDSLNSLVRRACKHDYKALMIVLGLPNIKIATDLAVLGLYDFIMIIDDSGSMIITEALEDGLSRFDVAKEVVKMISTPATLIDPDGIVVRFINSLEEGNQVNSSSAVEGLMKKIQLKSRNLTDVGDTIRHKIFNPILKPMLESQQLSRPIIVVTVTDGCPTHGQNQASLFTLGEQHLTETIRECVELFDRSKYGKYGICFSFAQIGSDGDATEFLSKLDTYEYIGDNIDCTSSYTIERAECLKKTGKDLADAEWVVKCVIGPIDPDYDSRDEGPTQIPVRYPSSAYQPQLGTASPYQQTASPYQQTASPYQQTYQQTYQQPYQYGSIPPPPYSRRQKKKTCCVM